MPVYKDEKRGTWFVSCYYTNWMGERKQKRKRGFQRQKDAVAWEREFLTKEAGSPDMSFSSMCALYLEDAKARIRPTSYITKCGIFRKRILPYFKDKPVNAITPADIRAWQNRMISEKADPVRPAVGSSPRALSQSYLKTVSNQLSAVFNFACQYYGLSKNPVRLAGSIGRARVSRMQFWTLAEFRRFIAVFPQRSAQRVIFSLLFYSGMRCGEMLALTPQDFDMAAGTVSINKTYARIRGRDVIQPPKTEKSARIIPLPPFLVDMLADYMGRLYGLSQNMRIFPMTRAKVAYYLKIGAAASGVPCIRVHDLRHSHASLLIEMGCSPLLVKERLGHENIETTLQVYSHLYPAKQEEITARLDRLMSDESPKSAK